MPSMTSAQEEQRISRAMMVWINACTCLPASVSRVNFEALEADKPSMALATVSSSIVQRYIMGGHLAEYAFSIIYRVKPGASNDERLKADEVLNAIGDWAEENPPVMENFTVRKCEATARAAMLGAFENGDEDHQILMKLTYEVI